jgi:hypothetical protein
MCVRSSGGGGSLRWALRSRPYLGRCRRRGRPTVQDASSIIPRDRATTGQISLRRPEHVGSAVFGNHDARGKPGIAPYPPPGWRNVKPAPPEMPTIRRIPPDSAPTRRVSDQARRRVSVRITPRAAAGGPGTRMAARRTRARRRRLLRLRHHRPRRVEHLGGGRRAGRLFAQAHPATAALAAAHHARAPADARASTPAGHGATPASRTDDDAGSSPGRHPHGAAPPACVPRPAHPVRHGAARACSGGRSAAPRAGAPAHRAAAAAGGRARRTPPLPPYVTAPAEGQHVRRHHDAGDHRPRGPRDRHPAPPLPLTPAGGIHV